MKEKFLQLCREKFDLNIKNNTCFEKANYQGNFHVSFYKSYCDYSFVEKGGIKEGWERFELNYNKKDYERLKNLLKYL